jgi:sulfotransferase
MIHFISGFPRSGSTLLCGLLAQNPANHVTATNDLVDLMASVRNQWTNCEGFIAQGIDSLKPRIRSLLRGMLDGFYAQEFAADKTVFDKSRGWIGFIDLLENVLERKVKVIVTVRDIPSICASLEKLHFDNALSAPSRSPQQQIKGSHARGRCEQYLSEDAMTGMFINRWRNALERGWGDRMIVVPYKELIADPVGIVRRIHIDCGLEPFVCNPLKVEKAAPEDDNVRKLPFHTLRESVDATAMNRGQDVLPPDVREWLTEDFPIVNRFATGAYTNGIGA